MRRAPLVLFALVLALAAVVVLGCEDKKKEPPPSPTSPSATTAASAAGSGTAPPVPVAADDGRALVAGACLSCHAEEMLAQQRLGRDKWAAEVKKMAGWGANLDPPDEAKLVSYLADTYGPDAGAYSPPTITAAEATKAIAAEPDGPFGGGDAQKGAKLFAEKCAACHGPDAKGAIGLLGVNLVERPVLRRAAEFAAMVRKGRGKMTPVPNATNGDVADLLAHLRGLRLAP